MNYLKFTVLPLFVLSIFLTPLLALSQDAKPDATVAKGEPKEQLIVPECNPALPPDTAYDKNEKDTTKIPCGLNKFIELIQNIIKYLSLIIIPIAVLMIGWGGFQILTSAGSEEKLGSGKKAMVTAVTGIVIMLVSYLIIKFVFDALGVGQEFRGSLFK